MIRESLNGTWSLTNEEGLCISCTVPGSVYAALLSAKRMEDPYQADHELAALKLMEQDYTFTRTFRPSVAMLACAHQVLRFDGIDTLADVFLNGRFLGHTDNMHRYWEYDVRGILRDGENELAVAVKSPTRYIAAEDEKAHLGGTTDAMRGFPHLRKSHCMFG